MPSRRDSACAGEAHVHRGCLRDGVRPASRCGESERHGASARSFAHDHHLKSGLSVLHAGAKRGELELTLADADENERREILASRAVDSQHTFVTVPATMMVSM